MKKYFLTLGLEEGASQEQIQKAFERLSKELNPANNDNQEFFVEEFKKVQEAYIALSNSSILATNKGAKNHKKKSIELNKEEPKSLDKLFIKSLEKKYKKLRSKQNITILFLIFSIVFNIFTYIKVQGDNNAISVSKSHMNQAEGYMNQAEEYSGEAWGGASNAEEYVNQAEDYSQEARRYRNQAEEYMNYAMDYMNQAEDFLNQARYK